MRWRRRCSAPISSKARICRARHPRRRAARAGFDRDEIGAYLARDEDKALIEDQDQHARSLGVEGVPFFIFNRRYAVSGAQPPEAILDVMEKAQEELAAAPQ